MQDLQRTGPVFPPVIKRFGRWLAFLPNGGGKVIESPDGQRTKSDRPLVYFLKTLPAAAGNGLSSFPDRLGPAAADTLARYRAGTSKASRALIAQSKALVAQLSRTDIRSAFRALINLWRRLLLFCHFQISDRSLNRLLFVTSPEQSDPASVLSGRLSERTPTDRPVPTRLFDWALDIVRAEAGSCTFVAFNAGRGQPLLLASRYPFESILGAEPSPGLHDDALMNISQFPRSLMKCRSVDCLNIDPVELPVPKERAVYYFFAPLERERMERLIDRLVASYRSRPRRFTIIAIDPRHEDIIQNAEVFEPVTYPAAARFKIALLSPFRIAAYRTLV